MATVPGLVESGRLKHTRSKTLDRHAEWWEMRRQGFTLHTIANKYGVSFQAVSKAMLAMEEELYKVLAAQAAPMKASQTAMLEANLERALMEWFKSQQSAETERVVEKSLAATSEEEDPGPLGGRLKRRRKQPLEAGELAEESDTLDPDTIDYESIPGYFYDEKTGEETLPEERPRIVAAWVLDRLREERKGGRPMAGLLERTVTNVSEGQCGDPRYLAEIRACLADIRKIWGLDSPVKQELTGKDGGPVNVVFTESLARVYGGE